MLAQAVKDIAAKKLDFFIKDRHNSPKSKIKNNGPVNGQGEMIASPVPLDSNKPTIAMTKINPKIDKSRVFFVCLSSLGSKNI